MTRRANTIETLNTAVADFNSTVVPFDFWSEDYAWDKYTREQWEDYDMDESDDNWADEYLNAPVVENTYECNGKEYVATSLEEAYLMALNEFGVDAIGKAVTCKEKNAFLVGVCLESYRKAFPTFTDEDYLAYEVATNYAWVNYGKEKGYDYWEECETVTLCDDGVKFIRDYSKLARYMDTIDFRW